MTARDDLIELIQQTWHTNSNRVPEWHPDDRRLYREGEFGSYTERSHAIERQRQQRFADAILAAGWIDGKKLLAKLVAWREDAEDRYQRSFEQYVAGEEQAYSAVVDLLHETLAS